VSEREDRHLRERITVLERELRAAHLEYSAKQSTDRINLEAQLHQAQKLQGIGRLAGGVAHDFNNLITIILGYAQMALDELPAQDPLREAMAEIVKAALHGGSLTRQLLAFSRRQISQPRDIAMNDVVRDFEKMLKRLIGEDIEVVLSLHPEAGTVRADPYQIEQVIMNLVINARDAMPNGGKVYIETACFEASVEFAKMHLAVLPGTYVLLSVSDTGTGMPAEVKEHIFEPFFTTKEPGKGTGLGLSTVYGIVTQCAGSISVYSEPGHGSTFRMLFPAVEVGAIVPKTAPLPRNCSGHETILVAEDEAGLRKYVRRILEGKGYKVVEASNGNHALEVARLHNGPIHLLLTDIVMPVMGGVDLVGEFSSLRPNVPVLCMSGYSERLWRQGELTGYIQKPFTPLMLLNQVRSLLDIGKTGVGIQTLRGHA
jgi:two-component system, cell cycle sensor histidine kinase and response regulator CckA